MRGTVVLATVLGLALSGCVYVHDSRSSSVVEAESSEDGELVEGVEVLGHEQWAVVLEGEVTLEGVDYEALLEGGEQRLGLRSYLRLLGEVDPRQLVDREEKIAYYVNLYNATVLSGVLDRLEEDSSFRVDQESFEFFDAPLVNLEGRLMSLNVLEHALVRGDLEHDSASVSGLDSEGLELVRELHEELWQGDAFEPRIHFLLNCASTSCPPLRPEPVRGEDYDEVAETATSEFLADPDRGAGPEGISQIFNWFADDFTAAGYSGPGEFIGEYRSAREVDLDSFLTYDWSLNRRGE